jgi:fatty acid desaturase
MPGEEFRDDVRRRLPAQELEPLSRLSVWRSLLAIGRTLGSIALVVGFALWFWSVPAVVLAVLLIAPLQHALFVLAHEAAHYRLFPSRFWNDLVGCCIGAAGGVSMRTYRVIHRLHHNHLYQAQDPDIALHGGYPRGRWYLLKKLAKDLSGVTAWKTYSYFFGAPAENTATGVAQRPLDDTAPRLRLEAERDRRFVITWHLGALVFAIAMGFGWKYVLLWLLPLATVLQAILRLRAICEHGATSDFSSPLTAARSNVVGPMAGFLLFPHHVNYHIEHHLYPAVPHYHLPALREALERHGILAGAFVQPLTSTLRQIFADPVPARA